jgi:hypothetical protein
MRNKQTYFFLALVTTSAILIRAIFGGLTYQQVYGENMSTHNPRIDSLFLKTKAVCVGRFLIDVPEQAIIVYGPSETPWPISTYLGKAGEIDTFISDRLAEIADEKRFVSGALRDKGSLVGRVLDGAAPGQKIVIGVSKGSGRIYRMDSYTKVGEDLFVQRATPIPSDKDEAIHDLNAIAVALSSRADSEVPAVPGVCIERGFIAETASLSYEAVNLGVRMLEFPDVHFSLSMIKKDKLVESDALEPRIKQAEEIARREGHAAWYERIKILRRGYRQLNKWQGFEILSRKPAQATEEESHEFAFLSQGQPSNPYLPVLDLEFHSGVQGNQIGGTRPSVTDDEAVAIWDRLTSSIRVRPVDQK